jgi:hypothetical protein
MFMRYFDPDGSILATAEVLAAELTSVFDLLPVRRMWDAGEAEFNSYHIDYGFGTVGERPLASMTNQTTPLGFLTGSPLVAWTDAGAHWNASAHPTYHIEGASPLAMVATAMGYTVFPPMLTKMGDRSAYAAALRIKTASEALAYFSEGVYSAMGLEWPDVQGHDRSADDPRWSAGLNPTQLKDTQRTMVALLSKLLGTTIRVSNPSIGFDPNMGGWDYDDNALRMLVTPFVRTELHKQSWLLGVPAPRGRLVKYDTLKQMTYNLTGSMFSAAVMEVSEHFALTAQRVVDGKSYSAPITTSKFEVGAQSTEDFFYEYDGSTYQGVAPIATSWFRGNSLVRAWLFDMFTVAGELRTQQVPIDFLLGAGNRVPTSSVYYQVSGFRVASGSRIRWRDSTDTAGWYQKSWDKDAVEIGGLVDFKPSKASTFLGI